MAEKLRRVVDEEDLAVADENIAQKAIDRARRDSAAKHGGE